MLTRPSTPRRTRTGAPHRRFPIALPEPGLCLQQDSEWCVVELDGRWQKVRFHDYGRIYRIPGLYEHLFYDVLKCDSPAVVCGLLAEVLAGKGVDPKTLCAFDLGAGNGMMAEQLARIGVPRIVGVDLLPEARQAALRDRPGLYEEYLATDLTSLGRAERGTLESFPFNCLTCVAALGFGDIPVRAFATAYNLVDRGGWIAFNIKEDFLSGQDPSGFSRLISAARQRGALTTFAEQRYRHRLSTNGEALHYVAFVGRKEDDLPEELIAGPTSPVSQRRLPTDGSAGSPAVSSPLPTRPGASPAVPESRRVTVSTNPLGNGADLVFHDYSDSRGEFLRAVLEGLRASPKSIPSKFLYDQEGSQLFDRICETRDYYPTRTEVGILTAYAGEMADCIGTRAALIEFGSGSSIKTRILLDHLADIAAYLPVDISRDHLLESAATLAADHPGLNVIPVCADFTAPFELPDLPDDARRVVFFPGSTIGNFDIPEIEQLLRLTAALCRHHGGMLIGVDYRKDRAILEAAYDDSDGATRAFTLNLLTRMNRELSADFDPSQFDHVAEYNEPLGRIEIFIESKRRQVVRVDGEPIAFEAGERVRTEYSQKFSQGEWQALADRCGFDITRVWTDPKKLFSVQFMTAR